MNYYIYILKCADDSLYTGITNDLRKRVEQHNGVRKGGAKYTRSHRPVHLAHIEKYASRSEATQREHKIKEMTHREKVLLIRSTLKEAILAAL
jgi:putative endonuclease